MANDKFLDKTGLTYLWSKLKTMFSNKVDKVTGKGLSTEDYTSAEKTKLSGIAENANNYTLPKATSSVLGGVKIGTNVDVSQGVISVKNSSILQKGVVQLYNGVDSTSTEKAAAANSVKTAYDKGDNAMNYAANYGVKNFLKLNPQSTSSGGVTITVNSDGTITSTGSTSNSAAALQINNNVVLPAGDYILSGCPSGGSDSTYRLDISGTQYYDTGSGVQFTSSGTALIIRMRIGANVSVNNFVWKPMIRRADVTSSEFVPYAPSNRELYEMILALQAVQ